LKYVHIVHPGEFHPPDLADVADGTGRMGNDYPRGRTVLQLHVTAKRDEQHRQSVLLEEESDANCKQ